MLIDNLCQAYHWTLDDAMSLTMPQLLMLNHAAHINQQRSQQRAEKDASTSNTTTSRLSDDDKDPLVNGKRLSQMNSYEIAAQFTGI